MATHEEFHDTPETVSAYDEVPLWSAAFGQLLLRELPMRAGQRVLDLGCGTGFPALELAERLGSTCQVVAMDPWPNALERARAKNLVYHVPNVEFLEGNGEDMPFDDGEFDQVVCNLGLNNWDHPERVLAECARVAKPGALLALTTNPQGHWKEFYEALGSVLSTHGETEALGRLRRQEAHRLDHERALPLFQMAGFSPLRRVQETLAFRYNDTACFLGHHFVGWGFKGGWRGALGDALWEKLLPEVADTLDQFPRDKGALLFTVPVEYWEFIKD
jgi:ubiquinone/menaquinone biosynthesis C-methylase UbiE